MTPPAEGVSGLVDTHAHLEDAILSADLAGVLARARRAGVVQVIAIGTTAADSATTLAIARDNPGVFAAVGVHPNHAAEAGSDDWARIEDLAAGPRVVAVGETGLDRYRDHTPFPRQQEWFDRHLALAGRLGLPVVIHCRQSERDIIDQLARLGRPVRGVLHSFTGTWDDAQAFLELGLHLSFAGMVTFTNKGLDPLREVAARVPLDRLLVETDSPYLSPHPHRGQSNEPARVTLTAERLAQVRGITSSALAQATTTNAHRLFNLSGDDILL
jgi:TatD DNase family protein